MRQRLNTLVEAYVDVWASDDRVEVFVNGRHVLNRVFAEKENTRVDIKPYLDARKNLIQVELYNGRQGGCGVGVKIQVGEVSCAENASKNAAIACKPGPGEDDCLCASLIYPVELE